MAPVEISCSACLTKDADGRYMMGRNGEFAKIRFGFIDFFPVSEYHIFSIHADRIPQQRLDDGKRRIPKPDTIAPSGKGGIKELPERMKKMKLKNKIFSVILLILLLGNAGGNIHMLFASYGSAFPVVLAATALLAVLSALYYTFRGYSKKAAPAYKAYMIICGGYFMALCCANAVNVSAEIGKIGTSILTVSNCLIFGLFLLLAFSKDMGRKPTYAVCTAALLLTLIEFIAALVVSIRMENADYAQLIGTRGLTRLLLVVIAFFMAGFKYADKAKRGTE